MNAIEFACFFERLQKSIGYQIDSDIVGQIFDYYEGSYENYTLLELISMLSRKNIKIDCAFNKKAIIEMIEQQEIDIPKQYEAMQPTSWWMEEGGRYNYIFIPNMYFAFYEGDIFKTQGGMVWELDHIESYEEGIYDEFQSIDEEPDEYLVVVYMYFINKLTGDDICKQADDFIYSLDYEDTTIVHNNNMILKQIMPYEYAVYE
jgi:hypothetical protein